MRRKAPAPYPRKVGSSRGLGPLSFASLFLIAGCAHVADRRPASSVDPEAKRVIIEQITALFENATPHPQYGYAERLLDSDKRGITFGKIGFTSCQDGGELLAEYDRIRPGNRLHEFRAVMDDALEERVACTDNVRDLEVRGFISAVKDLADDADFRQAQDAVAERRYFRPSAKLAKRLGLVHAWSWLVVYDSFVQHGEGEGEGIDELVKRTRAALHGATPKSGASEFEWMKEFLDQRRRMLSEGDEEWKRSVGRVDALWKIHEAYGNDELEPFEFAAGGYGVWRLPAAL